MTDIKIQEYHSLAAVNMDWLILPSGLLDTSEELATAVRVALGSDAQASELEDLPDPDSVDRRGWWGDMDAAEIWDGWPIGCKNWLLTREKIADAPSRLGSTLERARQYTLDALQPFIDKRIATQIMVDAARTTVEEIVVRVVIYRGPKMEIDLRYQLMWTEG